MLRGPDLNKSRQNLVDLLDRIAPPSLVHHPAEYLSVLRQELVVADRSKVAGECQSQHSITGASARQKGRDNDAGIEHISHLNR